MKEGQTQEPVKIFIADFKNKLLREKSTQSFGRADHWNTESEAEHNEAYEAHLAYQSTLKQYRATWLTLEMDGKELIEGKDFFVHMKDTVQLFRLPQEPVGGIIDVLKNAVKEYLKNCGSVDRPDLIEIDFTNGFKAGYSASLPSSSVTGESEERKFTLKEALDIYYDGLLEDMGFQSVRYPIAKQYFKDKFGIDI